MNESWFEKVSLPGKERFELLFDEMTFEDYLSLVEKDPKVTRTAFQRLYDMIMSYKTIVYKKFKEPVTHYNFFDDTFFDGEKRLFGLDKSLMKFVNILKSAAQKLGQERRVILLLGPVGSGKSTMLDLLKKGLENYSKTEQGRLYASMWVVDKNDEEGMNILGNTTEYDEYKVRCPIWEEPLRLLPEGEIREAVVGQINFSIKKSHPDFKVGIEGSACPLCRYYFSRFLERYKGDWQEVFRKHVRAYRLVLSEKDRCGIGTFQPVDEKNQDSSELTGDINFRKLAKFGMESDPRVFNFQYGEFNTSNRGLLEFIEVLKLEDAFLYPLLEASQSHVVKPKGFSRIDIDEVIIGHTNEAEFKKLQKNERMEAFKDRTIKVNIPNVIVLTDEMRIYERDYGPLKIEEKHIAPHTIEMVALWAVLTRLQEPKKTGLTLIQKAKLYDGKTVPGYSEETVKELQAESEAEHEGMDGISPRYIQDKIANCLVAGETNCVSPFMLIGENGELEAGLEHHPLIGDKSKVEKYKQLLRMIREEYEKVVQTDVQKAITGDPEAVKSLFGNYIENIVAYVQGEKIKDKFTGKMVESDETLMRSVENKLDPPEPDSRKEDFRRKIMSKIGALALEGKKFEWDFDERLRKALELKLFEDRKDTIRLSSIVSSVMDEETRKKIEGVKAFMIKHLGYCEACAGDALDFVASIFARGSKK